MSTAICCKYEYRCTCCFQALYAMTDEAGSEKPCRYCGTILLLPDASPDRIARAENVPDEELIVPETPIMLRDSQMTDEQMRQEVKRQMYVAPGDMICLSSIASSRVKRFFGYLIDSFFTGVAAVVGALLMITLMTNGFIDKRAFESQEFNLDMFNAYAAVYFPVLAFLLFQWNMIATHGKSVGKFCLGMRIVTDGGRRPGFIRGVVLRSWATSVLNMIPLFGFADAVCIFGETHRCIHDFIAGTYVVDD